MMNESKRLTVLKAILSVAWVDGDYADREQALMSEIMSAFQLDTDERRSLADAEYSLPENLAEMLVDADERSYLYQQAVKMSYADGMLSEIEQVILSHLQSSLDIGDQAAETADALARAMQAEDDGQGSA